MPEGPEIRLAADRIAEVLVGHEIQEVRFAFPGLRRFSPRLRGAEVTAVETRGKAMLTHFDNGLTLYSHNQLYGRWYVTERDRLPDTNRSLRVALHTARHSALLYSASDVEVLQAEALDEHPFLSRIGPDILDEKLTDSAIASRLEDERFRRRATGTLYLDQAFLAGVGNYLRSEILFRAGVHPSIRPADLDKAARRLLARQTLAISRRSYRTRGITIPRGKARDLKSQGLDFEQYRFWVFGREDQTCYECATPIERIQFSSRGLYLCPTCQPES